VWFQDEMRVGQKNPPVRVWAETGSRPRQPADHRTESAYLFGAVAPEHDKTAALVMPRADSEAMEKHLAEISREVAPGRHAVVVMDQASWHSTPKLRVPDNVSILLLPPRCPELNPVERVWQHLRQTFLSNRVFDAYEDIVEACCEAWNRLRQDLESLRSIVHRDWAAIGQSR
jgi:transposase